MRPEDQDPPPALSFDPRTWQGISPPEQPATPPRRKPVLLFAVLAVIAVAGASAGAWYGLHPATKTRGAPTPGASRTAAAAPSTPAPTGRLRVIRGEMNQLSFYTSAVAAGVDDRLIAGIAAAFAYDFDFVREIHPGDTFEVALEDGQGAGAAPNVVYVALTTHDKSAALYRYRGGGAAPDWYDGEGHSVRRLLMRTPVESAHVTSNFGMRDHPVLGYTRMHKGVDFGVPIGTPVYASGDGTVDAIGVHEGYGYYLRIRHKDGLATAYGHLSGYPGGVAIGSAVHQGEVVAYSGNSGISTGPHLHYEIIAGGEQTDPLAFKPPSGPPLQGASLSGFRAVRDTVDAARARAW